MIKWMGILRTLPPTQQKKKHIFLIAGQNKAFPGLIRDEPVVENPLSNPFFCGRILALKKWAMLTTLRSKKEVLRNDLATWTSQHMNPFTQKPRHENRSPFDVPSNIIYIEFVLQGLGSQCSVLTCLEFELFFLWQLRAHK